MEIAQIHQKIYEIRGQNFDFAQLKKVMLDFDLAELYEVETRVLKQSVKRNIDRFPLDFMFELDKKEWVELITNCYKLKTGIKFSPITPMAFTEHGVTMLSSVLKSKRAVNANIQIIRAFIELKRLAISQIDFSNKLKALEQKYDKPLRLSLSVKI